MRKNLRPGIIIPITEEAGKLLQAGDKGAILRIKGQNQEYDFDVGDMKGSVAEVIDSFM